MPGNFRCWLRPPLSDRAAPVRSARLIRHHPVQQRYSLQALRLFVHRQKPFRTRLHKIFKILQDAVHHGAPCGFHGERVPFLNSIHAGRSHHEGVDFISPSGNRWRPNLDRPQIGTPIWA